MISRTQLYRLMIYQSKNNYLLLILFVISDTIMEKYIINNFFNILINYFLFNFIFYFIKIYSSEKNWGNSLIPLTSSSEGETSELASY